MNKKKKPSANEPKGFSGTLYTVMHDVVMILAIITFCFVFLARLVGVSGSSMYPTLVGEEQGYGTKGDYLILESNVLHPDYKQGDIVVACVPSFDEGKPIVKRVIATEGQTVSLKKDETGEALHVYVDGIRLEEDYIREDMMQTFNAGDGYFAIVPEGCYFLMGDNRNNSTDSRDPRVGMVDSRYIVGKALLLALPGEDWGDGNRRSWSRFGAIGK